MDILNPEFYFRVNFANQYALLWTPNAYRDMLMCIFTPCLFFKCVFYQFSMRNYAFTRLICSSVLSMCSFIYYCKKLQGFFSSQIVSFFPKRGPKIPNLLQTAKVKTLSTKIECAMHKFQKARLDKG